MFKTVKENIGGYLYNLAFVNILLETETMKEIQVFGCIKVKRIT